ncbi:hypothetical protein SCOCK_30270 [Actinacidiphila cocklensis]|uniref:Uncharacterized protein n=1 Tax=Actinacidiphila cocklensis TaxID=887465 RepID=A0A9W4E7U4_9ACTN|nr:hypothetical protein SCOCK_30270 [Actinacidiphila cocklensis]
MRQGLQAAQAGLRLSQGQGKSHVTGAVRQHSVRGLSGRRSPRIHRGQWTGGASGGGLPSCHLALLTPTQRREE